MQAQDLRLHLERNWGIKVPGYSGSEVERERERGRERERERQTDRQTDTQTGRHTDRHRQRDRETERESETERRDGERRRRERDGEARERGTDTELQAMFHPTGINDVTRSWRGRESKGARETGGGLGVREMRIESGRQHKGRQAGTR